MLNNDREHCGVPFEISDEESFHIALRSKFGVSDGSQSVRKAESNGSYNIYMNTGSYDRENAFLEAGVQ